jgi:hypothetical protein
MAKGQKPRKHHGMNATEILIDELRQSLADEKTARRVDVQEARQRVDLESQFRTTAMNELIAGFDGHDRAQNGLRELVRVLMWGVRAAHPLRGIPQADTMRIGHPELTSTEAAADADGRRMMLKRWNGRLLRLAGELDADLSGSDEPKKRMPAKPRCRKRGCDLMDKSLPYGSRLCPSCGEPLPVAA